MLNAPFILYNIELEIIPCINAYWYISYLRGEGKRVLSVSLLISS